ncbi:MAG: PAS domain-containing protein [Legionellales bacterium]|nr:PAS domain-containing protein [Legionellales bacterium]
MKTQEEHWLQQDFFVQLLNLLPSRIFWKNKESVFLGCNKAFYESFGFTAAEQIIGLTDYDLPMTPKESEGFRNDDIEVMSSKQPKLNIQEVQTFPDGKQLHLLTSKVPLTNQTGEVIGVLGIYNDVTDLKKMAQLETEIADEKRYWVERDFLLELLEQLPSHVFWKNRESVYLGCNKAFYESLGFQSAEQVIGLTDYDLAWTKEESDAYRADDKAVMESKTAKINLEESQTVRGRHITLLTNKVPLLSKKGEVLGVLGIYTDITERKEMEMREKEAIQALAHAKANIEAEETLRRAVTVLASSIAHDLRTPLASALLRIDLMGKSQAILAAKCERDILDEKELRKDIANYIERSNSSMRTIKKIIYDMNDFIDVTLKSMQRLVTGTLGREDFTSCSIESCLNQVVIRYPFKENEKSLIHINEIKEFLFLGIPVLFYRILFNLLGNAFYQIAKHNRGEIFITTETGKDWNILRVKDTAGGVSPGVLEHLFEGFKTSRDTGTGVGLAFCKLTMESFGGSITAHSVEGDYIEFVLLFPNKLNF